VLFLIGQANKQERTQLLEAIFDYSRDEVAQRVKAGTLPHSALAARDYVYDVFPDAGAQSGGRLNGAAD